MRMIELCRVLCEESWTINGIAPIELLIIIVISNLSLLSLLFHWGFSYQLNQFFRENSEKFLMPVTRDSKEGLLHLQSNRTILTCTYRKATFVFNVENTVIRKLYMGKAVAFIYWMSNTPSSSWNVCCWIKACHLWRQRQCWQEK